MQEQQQIFKYFYTALHMIKPNLSIKENHLTNPSGLDSVPSIAGLRT